MQKILTIFSNVSNLSKGVFCIVASAFGFALMAFFVRLTDDWGAPISCFQKGFFRNVVAFAIALAVFTRQPRQTPLATPSTEHQARGTPHAAQTLLLLARCLFGTFGIFANFYAISHIPVGEAMALNKTAPFFTVLVSALLLGERASRRQLAFLVLAFTGALLVVKPGWRITNLSAALIGLSSGLAAGLAYVCVHQLGRWKVNGARIVLYFSGFSCLAALPFMLCDFRPMTGAQFVILLCAGAGAAIGQFGITAAYRFAEPRAIAAFDYVGVVFSALFGFLFFAQVPDALSVLGFLAIVIAAVFISSPRDRKPTSSS